MHFRNKIMGLPTGSPVVITKETAMKTEESRVKYEIAYDITRQLVIVYPQWRGARANTQVIGEYAPKNPRANVEDYVDDLADTIRESLARVGQLDLDPFKVMITPLDGTPEVMAKDFGGPLRRVTIKDQVPVGANTTVAQAAQEESEKGEGEPQPSQVTKKVVEATDENQFEGPQKPEPKRAATKKTAKKTTKG